MNRRSLSGESATDRSDDTHMVTGDTAVRRIELADGTADISAKIEGDKAVTQSILSSIPVSILIQENC